MPQSSERRQTAAPAILRRNVPARLVSLGRLYLRYRIDDPVPRARLFPFPLREETNLTDYISFFTAKLPRREYVLEAGVYG
jgi:hypothetical protein